MKNMIEFYKWADNKIIDLLQKTSEEDFNKKITQRSLRDLSEHMMVYLEWYLHPEKSFEEIMNSYKSLSKDQVLDLWKTTVSNFVDTVLSKNENEKVSMPVSKGKTVDVNFDENVFAYTDHSSYHRGQIITHYKLATGKKEAVGTDHYSYLMEKYNK